MRGAIVDVEDDGKGFVPADVATPSESGQGLGLLGMRERLEILGGTLEIDLRLVDRDHDAA